MSKRMGLAVAVLALALPAFAQEMSGARGEAKATVAGKTVSIDYGRPSLKGRDMLAQAQVGQAWRMGASEATSLRTDADLTFGTVRVPKGEYILTATKLDAQHWQLNVLAKADRSKVADVPFASESLPQSVEQFTIELTGAGSKGDLKLSWGTTALRAAFTAK
jgi:DUF2911 family protein